MKKWIGGAVLATLALTSCENRQEQYEQDLINSCNVRAMTGITVTTTAVSTCTGNDTSWTNQFASCYVVNIGSLPEVDDVRYDTYSFYAVINGKKVIGGEAVLDELNRLSANIVENAVYSQFSVNDLNIIIPIELLYSAKFYVDAGGNTRELQLKEVY
tara:strand:+ start:331 stop:804 length:474 start_codon:yes stop_codon:yes gene_type:complete